MARLVTAGITLDMCPTSNVKLRAVADVAAHPIRQFHERGMRVTVSTDNPTILGCTLTGELRLLVERFDFSLSDLARLQRYAFQAALLSPAERGAIVAELDSVLGDLEVGRGN
jgi:adenosine deaminase